MKYYGLHYNRGSIQVYDEVRFGCLKSYGEVGWGFEGGDDADWKKFDLWIGLGWGLGFYFYGRVKYLFFCCLETLTCCLLPNNLLLLILLELDRLFLIIILVFSPLTLPLIPYISLC